MFIICAGIAYPSRRCGNATAGNFLARMGAIFCEQMSPCKRQAAGQMAKHYKRHKRGGAGRHVQLPEWLQVSEAWATMKPGPRALYVELKRRFNGMNNGAIYLSHRDAARALNVHRNTVGPMFRELAGRGFIRMTCAPYLGPSGIGEASVWALEELPTQHGKSAGKAFMRWSAKENPRTKFVPTRHKKQDANGCAVSQTKSHVTKYVPTSAENGEGASQ